MKKVNARNFIIYFFLGFLLSLSPGSSQKSTLLLVPGGAIFKNPKKIVVPEGKTWILPEDTYLRIDRLEIYGTIFTRGHLFSAFIGKLVFGPKGVIKTFDKTANDSLIQLPVPATPPASSDQKKNCQPGFSGALGESGNNGVADPLTDGRKNPQPIKIFAAELEGVARIESIGQKGGKGMKGGIGGKGGQGGRGGEANADKGFLGLGGSSCDGGTGGVGGKGGVGGNGGVGGIGGPAPQVEFIVANLRTEQIFSDSIFLREGEGGKGGEKGEGGEGGEGGSGGSGDSAPPITQSLWGNSAKSGAKGVKGQVGELALLVGDDGAKGTAPKDSDRVFANFKQLDDLRREVFGFWQEFHWRRHLLAHVQDSFRLIQKKIFTRQELKVGLDEDKALFQEFDKKQLKRILEAWQKGFILPLEDTLKANVTNERIQRGLRTAYGVVNLLTQINDQTELVDTQKKLGDMLYGDEGILKLNESQIAEVSRECVRYNTERLKTNVKYDHIGLYFQIPSCEGRPDFRKKENLNADIILADLLENDIQPNSLEEILRQEGSGAIFSKLQNLILPFSFADTFVEHPLLSVKLIPFSVKSVREGKTIERDEVDLGLIHRLRMKNEKEVWSNNFYQELRAFAVMTGANL